MLGNRLLGFPCSMTTGERQGRDGACHKLNASLGETTFLRILLVLHAGKPWGCAELCRTCRLLWARERQQCGAKHSSALSFPRMLAPQYLVRERSVSDILSVPGADCSRMCLGSGWGLLREVCGRSVRPCRRSLEPHSLPPLLCLGVVPVQVTAISGVPGAPGIIAAVIAAAAGPSALPEAAV